MHRELLLLLLTTTAGRVSGEPRTAPVMFVDADGDSVVIASNDGAADHPQWYRNLEARPRATVETPDGERWQASARTLDGGERTARWRDLTERFPFFTEHQERAGGREIPLVVLQRA